KNLLRIDNGNALTNGVASKFSAFAKGLLATDGLFSSKDASLKRSLERNADDQARLNDKVARVEAALNRRYSALDVQLSSLNALNAYVTQQVTLWNQSSSSK
ncbi:MAG: flagellar cap protein FliD, partial [Rhodoferax sp.]|nr:flagellar cap protein FliD [Rhodoferax sp.]